MAHVRKFLPWTLLFAVMTAGGLSVLQAQEPRETLSFGGACDCQLPNSGEYGLLEPDPDDPGEQRCNDSASCDPPKSIQSS